MFDLKSSGLNLKELQTADYGRLIEDLNYNFTQILNLPGFKGTKGETVEGPPGTGIRGSKWIFVKLTDLKTAYNIISADQIDLNLMNNLFADDSTKLFASLDIPLDNELLIGDICVLPSGEIIELAYLDGDEVEIKFIDTGITFAQIATLSESRVIEIFNDLFQNGNQTEGALRYYTAVAKNNTDDSPALNRAVNNDSVIDIVASNTGPGAALPDFTFMAPPEQRVGDLTKMCLIAGSPQRYHKLIQETQRIHTNNYAPGVDDFAAHVIMQNSYKNGMLFGHKNSESIRDFGRLYRSANATVLTSSYSPHESEYSEINLFDTQAVIRALKATIKADTTEILSATFNSPFFTWSGNIAELANKPNAILNIYAPGGTYLKNILGANVLSTDAQGKLTKVYSVLTAMPTTPANSQLLTALAVKTYMDEILSQLGGIGDDLDDLKNRDTSGFFRKQTWYETSTNLNTVVGHGNSLIKKGTSISNFVAGISTAPFDMHINNFLINSGTSHRLLQEVTMGGGALGNFMSGIKWFRVAEKVGTGQWSFGLWSKSVTNADTPTGVTPIDVHGDFASGLKISHKKSNAGSTNNYKNTQVIQNITMDEFGHPQTIESKDLATIFLGSDAAISGLLWSATNKMTLRDVLIDLVNMNRPKTIVTGTFDVGSPGSSTWFTIPYNNTVDQASGHNIPNHTVKYRRTHISEGADFVDIEIATTGAIDSSYFYWEWDGVRLLSAGYVSEHMTRGEPLYQPQELRAGYISGSIAGSSVRRFYLGEGNGAPQNSSLKVVLQNKSIFVQNDSNN